MRLLHFLNWTTSKTKQFCETSSSFELDNIKTKINKAILRDALQKWKVECRAEGLVPMRFAIFPVHLSKVLRLPRKSDARSYEVLHLSSKIRRSDAPKCNLSENQRPHLLTAPMKIYLVYCACHGKSIFADLQMSHACHRFWKCDEPSRFAHF